MYCITTCSTYVLLVWIPWYNKQLLFVVQQPRTSWTNRPDKRENIRIHGKVIWWNIRCFSRSIRPFRWRRGWQHVLVRWHLYRTLVNGAIPRKCLGTKHTNFSLGWHMFFFKYLSCYLTNFDETMRIECVIVYKQRTANHRKSKSKEPVYRFWEHSSIVLVEIGTDRNGTHLKLKKILEC